MGRLFKAGSRQPRVFAKCDSRYESLRSTLRLIHFAYNLMPLKTFKPAIGDKIVETLYSNRVTSENKIIHTPPLSPPFKVGVFVVFYR